MFLGPICTVFFLRVSSFNFPANLTNTVEVIAVYPSQDSIEMYSFLLAKLRLLKPLFGQHRDNRNCYICARNFAECSQTTGETKHLHILATMHFTRSSESKKAFRSDTLQKRTFRWPSFYLFIYLFIYLLFFFLDKFPSLFCRRLVH